MQPFLSFKKLKYKPVDEDTLDAIGQIAMRKDLGAGPRTVINALVEAVKYNETMGKAYTPIELVNSFLDGKISFEERGKFASSVRKALENRIIQSGPEYGRVIKLISAFPLGCPRATVKRFGLEIPFEKLLDSEVYGEILYKQSEGYTLRTLLSEEVSADPTYFRLIRDTFIRSYAPDKQYANMAYKAFKKYILEKYFEPGRVNQLDKWQWEGEEVSDEIRFYTVKGTFNLNYPMREVMIAAGVSAEEIEPKWGASTKEITFAFLLNYAQETEFSYRVIFPPQENRFNEVFLQLNLLITINENVNLPRILSIFPVEKISPLFMLSLLSFLDDIEEKVPAPERTGELRVLKERLVSNSSAMIFSKGEIIGTDDEWVDVGEALIRNIFEKMCKSLYPEYLTLITNSQWEKNIQDYIKSTP